MIEIIKYIVEMSVTLLLAYTVIKAAVRNGVKEALEDRSLDKELEKNDDI